MKVRLPFQRLRLPPTVRAAGDVADGRRHALVCGAAVALFFLLAALRGYELAIQMDSDASWRDALEAKKRFASPLDEPRRPLTFVDNLPDEVSFDKWLADAHASASAEGVQLRRMSVVPSVATETRLGRVEVKIDARGSYRGLRRWVFLVLRSGQSPAVLESITIRRVTDPANLEAVFEASLISKPAGATSR